MYRILFQWRGVTLHAYPAFLFVGVVAGVIGGTYAAAQHGLDAGRILAAMLMLVFPALFGARVLFAAAHWKLFRNDPGRIWRRSDGGADMYGGLILAFLFSLPLLRAVDIPLGAFWDAATITMLIGMVFTRIGCFLNGCCAGKPSRFPLALYLPNVHGVWCRRVPTQLLEGGLGAVLLLGSIAVWDLLPFAGALFLGNLAAYGLGRWGLELTREHVERIGAVSLQRALSLGFVAVALVGFAVFSWTSETELPLATAAEISPWQLLLAPLAVFAILLLFRFVGCGLIANLGDFNYAAPSYEQAVTNDHPAAWWRLDETAPSTSPNGGTAADQEGAHPGIYTSPANGYPADSTTGSIGAPTPVILNLGTPGVLVTDSSKVAMEVQGGFVRVPQGGGLFQGSFTLELLTSFEWPLTQAGFSLPLLSCRDLSGNRGFVLLAGPDPNNPQNYLWQLRVGTGSASVTLVPQPATPRPADPGTNVLSNTPSYLVLTFDSGSSAWFLMYYHDNRNLDCLTYTLPYPGSGHFVPADAHADLLIGIDGPLQKPITKVQATGTPPAGPSSAAVTLTFPQATTSGNLLVLVIALFPGSGTNAVTLKMPPSDTYNNQWKTFPRAQAPSGPQMSVEMWYAPGCTGGPAHQITIQPSADAYVVLAMAEYAGISTASDALDQTSTNTDNGTPSTSASSGPITTGQAGELVIAAVHANTTIAAQAGWTEVFNQPGSQTVEGMEVASFGEAISAPAGVSEANWQFGAKAAWVACAAAFKPATPNPFNGKIAEVAVYSQVLAVESICTHGAAAFKN